MNYQPFNTLLGETLIAVEGMEPHSDCVVFKTESGKRFELFHMQDCCESVSVNEVIGNVSDLIGSPITLADESSNSENNPEHCESHTWTFYNLATVKGYVTLRWLGESNGYYSETVNFVEF